MSMTNALAMVKIDSIGTSARDVVPLEAGHFR